MRRHFEIMLRSHIPTGARSFIAEFYTQPTPRHLIALVYHHVWEEGTEPIARLLEPILNRRHYARCEENCGVGWDLDDNIVALCSYIPLTARRDLRCYDLMHHGRKDLGLCEIDPLLAVALGWPGEEVAVDAASTEHRPGEDSTLD